MSSVILPDDFLSDCTFSVWNSLTDERRREIGNAVLASLHDSGYQFHQVRLEGHGPAEEHPVLMFTDQRTGMDFALIPGGILSPGYDEAQLNRLLQITELVEYVPDEEEFEDEEEEGEEDDSEREEFSFPDRVPIFASAAPCDLRRRPDVQIAPFLMAVRPVPVESPEILELITPPTWWYSWVKRLSSIALQWQMVPPILEHFQWAVPTSLEFEWALTAGVQSLFYWGDELPSFVATDPAEYGEEYPAWTAEQQALITSSVTFEDVMEPGSTANAPDVWPHTNRFGLIGMVAQDCWCEPSNDPSDLAPLIVRGGAAGSYPWQACGEWRSLLNGAECRLRWDSDYGDWNGLRPVIRLSSFS